MNLRQLEAALHLDNCDWCPDGVEYEAEALMRCAWCENLACPCHAHYELGCCRSATCLYQAANALRERIAAAVVVLNATNPLTWQWNLRTALEILEGEYGKDK